MMPTKDFRSNTCAGKTRPDFNAEMRDSGIERCCNDLATYEALDETIDTDIDRRSETGNVAAVHETFSDRRKTKLSLELKTKRSSLLYLSPLYLSRRTSRVLRSERINNNYANYRLRDASATTKRSYRRKNTFLTKILLRTATGKSSWSLRRKLQSVSNDDGACFLKPSISATISSLSPFIPKLLHREIRSAAYSRQQESVSSPTQTRAFEEPSMKIIRGVVMVADVSGFTRLTDQLGKQGHAGIELLTLVINNYLTKAIEIVEAYNGDVIKFAGDSLIVAFYGEPDAGIRISLETFREIVSRALHCAQELSTTLGSVQMLPNGDIRPLRRLRTPLESILRRRESRKIKRGNSTIQSIQIADRRRDSAQDKVSGETSHSSSRRCLTRLLNLRESKVRQLSSDSGSFIRSMTSRWSRRGINTKERDEQQQQSNTSIRLSPATPEKSEHLLYRGSLYWRRSFDSRLGENSSIFQKVLEAGVMHLKVLVGCGDYCLFKVGGGLEGGNDDASPLPRWEYILADYPNSTPTYLYGHIFRQPLRQIAAIEDCAEEGDVIISDETLAMVDRGFEYEALEGAVRLVSQIAPGPSRSDTATEGKSPSTVSSPLQRHCAEAMRMFVIDNVRQKIELGYQDYISEIRRLSILFFGFPGLSIPDDEKARRPLESVQYVAETIQKWMQHYEGSFVQLRCDEKGFLAICAFGLAGSNHHDNAARAVTAALKIISLLKMAGVDTCVGITTGDLLCACIGAKHRSEYTLFGNAINLSARLMCKAKKGMGAILCDATTREKARNTARYQPIEEVKIKGLEEPVLIYLVSEPKNATLNRMSEGTESHHPMIGRRSLMNGITCLLQKYLREGRGGGVFIHGAAGSGRSAMLSEIERAVHGSDMTSRANILFSAGNAETTLHILYPWRRVFQYIFDKDLNYEETHHTKSGTNASVSEKSSVRTLPSRLADDAALFHSFISEIDLNRRMIDENKNNSLKELSVLNTCSDDVPSTSQQRVMFLDELCGICSRFVELYGPLIILFDDSHLFDCLSWDLLVMLLRKADSGVFIVATIRSNESIHASPSLTSREQQRDLMQTLNVDSTRCPHVLVLELGALDSEDIASLVESVADGSTVSESVHRYIREKSGGIPQYVQQITRYLKEQGRLETNIPQQDLTPNEGLMRFIRETTTVQQSLLEKLDHLDPTTHLALKVLQVTSVIGKDISISLLEAAYPFSVPTITLAESLKELERVGLLAKDEDQGTWKFRSLLDRDVLNDIVPQSQRRSLHTSVATALESKAQPQVNTTADFTVLRTSE